MSITATKSVDRENSTACVYAVGIGFRHACPMDEMRRLIEEALAELHLQPTDIAYVATSSHKADSPLVGNVVRHFGWMPRFFSRKVLAEFSERKVAYLSHYSFKALCHVGAPSIAESAALLAVSAEYSARNGRDRPSSSDEELTLPLQRSPHATLAIAKARVVPNKDSSIHVHSPVFTPP